MLFYFPFPLRKVARPKPANPPASAAPFKGSKSLRFGPAGGAGR